MMSTFEGKTGYGRNGEEVGWKGLVYILEHDETGHRRLPNEGRANVYFG